jgi:hypothetical protein
MRAIAVAAAVLAAACSPIVSPAPAAPPSAPSPAAPPSSPSSAANPPPRAPDAAAPPDRPPAGDAAALAPPPPRVDPHPTVTVTVDGYQLLVTARQSDGSPGPAVPYDIRGISWSPVEPGEGKPGPSGFTAAAARDLPLMHAANINTVKTYSPIERVVLDQLQANGMMAIITVAVTGAEDYASYVTAVRDHPAILMWVVGNEWNQNHLFGHCAGDACSTRVNEIARALKALDPRHPVATSFAPTGSIPGDSDVQRLDAVDVWGLNVYSQPGFFNRFQEWRLLATRTGVKKPFFISEYGADAYDQRAGQPDEASQAAALRQQTSEIRAQLSAGDPAFPCLGGSPFEWSDEWWKFGSWTTQDAGGFPNAGVAPDRFANEDWWGVVDIHRRPRAAYAVLRELYGKR